MDGIVVLTIILMIIFGIGLGLLPTWIALARKHREVVPILLLNLFLGWTIIGWIAALIWSATSNVKDRR